MSRHELAAAGIVDDACLGLSRAAAPWLGVFWATSIPYRFLQVHFVHQLLMLGPRAPRFGNHLGQIALATFLAFLPVVYGRLVWVRAALAALAGPERLGTRPLRVPPAELAACLYTTLVLEVLFHALIFTAIVPVAVLFVSGLGPATARRNDRPRLLAPLVELLRPAARAGTYARLLLLVGIGWAIGAVNLYYASAGALWLAGTALSDVSVWGIVLSFDNSLYLLLLGAGSILLAEPFLLAASAVFVQRLWSLETGEDLRAWFEEIRAESGR